MGFCGYAALCLKIKKGEGSLFGIADFSQLIAPIDASLLERKSAILALGNTLVARCEPNFTAHVTQLSLFASRIKRATISSNRLTAHSSSLPCFSIYLPVYHPKAPLLPPTHCHKKFSKSIALYIYIYTNTYEIWNWYEVLLATKWSHFLFSCQHQA